MRADAALKKYASRLGHLHLKDIRGDVLERVHAERLSPWEALEAGIFCPLGSGIVDLPACLAAITSIDYSGFATIEQDRVPGTGSPLEDLGTSLRVLAAAQRLA